MRTIGSGDDSVRPRSVWRARRLTGLLVLTLAVALTNSALTPLPTVGAGVHVPEAFVGAVNVVPGSGMFQTVIPLSGAEPAFPANPGLMGSETLVGVPPVNFDFTAAPIELGAGPSNADLSSGPIVATVLPVNAGFESGGLAGWETAGSPTTIAANGGTAGWLRESVDRLISSPVAVGGAASELQVDVGHTPSTGYSWLQIYVRSGPTYATSTLLDSVYCYNCGGTWNQRSFSLAAYAGQSVKIEFRAYLGNDVAVDNVAVATAGPIPNWEFSGNVKHVVENNGVLRVDGSSSYALSDPFTVAPTANRMTFRVRAESIYGGQVTVKIRHGAGYGTVTQGAAKPQEFGSWLLWPNWCIEAYPGGNLTIFHHVPTGPETTDQRIEWYFPQETPSDAEREIIDFVDVDSAKWTQYAQTHGGPKAWIYGREGRRLLDFERRAALAATRGFFVTGNETELFRRLARDCRDRVEPMCNGVDPDFFRPDATVPSPYGADELALVFTGAMDYHPNEDAAAWFAQEVMPLLKQRNPSVRFHVVGRAPTPAVQALASDSIAVSGTVPDVRPYLQHAAVVVAPLRIARGIQNKILEAMAMGRPVVASTECAGPIAARVGDELLVATTAEQFVAQIERLLANPDDGARVGAAARQRVVDDYSWQAHLSGIDSYLATGTDASEAAR